MAVSTPAELDRTKIKQLIEREEQALNERTKGSGEMYTRAQLLLVEDLVDEALVAHRHDVATLRRRDSRGLLSAMLEGVEREVREAGDVVPWGKDAEHAALVARPVAFVVVDGGRHTGQMEPDRMASLATAPARSGRLG